MNKLHREGSFKEKGTLNRYSILLIAPTFQNWSKIIPVPFMTSWTLLLMPISLLLLLNPSVWRILKITRNNVVFLTPNLMAMWKHNYVSNINVLFVDQHVLNFVHGTSELSPTQPLPHNKDSKDHVFNCASSVIGLGLMARNFRMHLGTGMGYV